MHALFLLLPLILPGVACGGESSGLSVASGQVAPQGELQPAIAQYDLLRLALVADEDADAVAAATLLGTTLASEPALAAAAAKVASAAGIEARRQVFGELSRLLVPRVAEANGLTAFVYFCPMVTEGYGYWIQAARGIGNPYMGTRMPKCGEESTWKAAVKAAGR